jgi:hypothetical protein
MLKEVDINLVFICNVGTNTKKQTPLPCPLSFANSRTNHLCIGVPRGCYQRELAIQMAGCGGEELWRETYHMVLGEVEEEMLQELVAVLDWFPD